MDAVEQARRYIAKMEPAVSGQGGHNQTLKAACYLLHDFNLSPSQAWPLLVEFNQRCAPPWNEHDLRRKLAEAEKQSPLRGRGSKGVRYKFGQRDAAPHYGAGGLQQAAANRCEGGRIPSANGSPAPKKYDLSGEVELPKPLADGTRSLLKAAFQPGEGICICQARENEEGVEVPKDAGHVLSREEWLLKLDEHGGDPNKFLFSRKEKSAGLNGLYLAINPLKLTGSRSNANVTSFRHALIEFDNISAREQWLLIQQSNIPCTAVVSSGGRSLHAWVRVDAVDRNEYNERVALLYSHFDQQQRPDEKNKDPARLSRLANCVRGERRQELLALNIGAESFSAWAGGLETEGIGREISVDSLLAFNADSDPNCIIGQRYLCKGGSMMVIGQSGIGKSSIAVQAAATWAIGRSLYGIAPARSLKSVFVQAENDDGDLAEMLQGVVSALNLTDEEKELLRKNLIFITDSTHIGDEFVSAAGRLIEKHRPDLFWGDPVLSFIGDDASKQHVCARFFRSGFGPIQSSTGVVTVWVHHTGKPPADPKAAKRKTITDHSYVGIGSSDMTNAMRAVAVLQRINDEHFELKLAKRGKRAGAKNLDGTPTLTVYLRQADVGIHWQQVDEPRKSKVSVGKEKGGRSKAEFDMEGFMSSLSSDRMIRARLLDRMEEYSAKMTPDATISRSTAERLLKEANEKFEVKDGLWSVQDSPF